MQFYISFQGRRSCEDQQADTLTACAEEPGGNIAQHGSAEDNREGPRRATKASGDTVSHARPDAYRKLDAMCQSNNA